MKLETLSTVQVDALPRDTVVLFPVASVEQHGPHLPVGTDVLIGEGIAGAVDEACGGKLLVLPTQKLGCAEHHMARAGTITLGHDLFRQSVLAVIDSMHRHGFRRFLISNSHGGNIAITGVIAEQAPVRWPDAQVVVATWFRAAASRIADLVEGDFPAVGHACEFETSLMLALHPDLVDMSRAVDDGLPPQSVALQGDLLRGPSAALAVPFDRLTRFGVFGKATLASEEKGRALLQRTTEVLRDLIREISLEGRRPRLTE